MQGTGRIGAFSSEVDAGSREENASKTRIEFRSDSIGTELAGLRAASFWCYDLAESRDIALAYRRIAP
jgi:hypothetical protein